jgi:hypothetical protein
MAVTLQLMAGWRVTPGHRVKVSQAARWAGVRTGR